MPVLGDFDPAHAPVHPATGPRPAGGLIAICSNPGCASGWLRWWRGRQAPVFEGGWLCGPQCVRSRLRVAVARELEGRNQASAVTHRHRIPLGLLLLSQGAITGVQLRAALARQRVAGGRLGMWLEREHGVEPRVITRALGTQWGCPVLTLENHSPEKAAGVAPRLFLDAFGFLPLRQAGTALLYVGFEDKVDRCVNLAIERMTGLRVEAGVVDSREYALAHRRLLGAAFPPARMVTALGIDALVGGLARAIEAAKPVESRLVRMHDYFWLRMWKRRAAPGAPAGPSGSAFEDVLGAFSETGV